MKSNDMICLTCASLSGVKRISPGPIIYTGTHWIVDHAYPTGLLGWLVIVLKTHKAALHELSQEEFSELAKIQAATIAALHKILNSEKEYVACFAEGEGFNHIHFHIIPKTDTVTDDLKGPRVFQLVKKDHYTPIFEEEIVKLSEILKNKLSTLNS